jgi:hypothetical protein
MLLAGHSPFHLIYPTFQLAFLQLGGSITAAVILHDARFFSKVFGHHNFIATAVCSPC